MKTNSLIVVLLCAFMSVFSLGYAQQDLTVKGTVLDAETGVPIAGCIVICKSNSRKGAFTDVNGQFAISVKVGTILEFSSIGYKTKEVNVTSAKLSVYLYLDEVALSQIVAFGLGDVQELRYEPSAEEYNSYSENKFVSPLKEALSSFPIDVYAASYSNIRRFVNQGHIPPKDAVRTEELINYFTYDYSQPKGKEPVNISTEIGECPWNKQHRLLKIGLKAKEIADDKLPASNLVFLIDVSGSMYGPTRLELVKSSLKLLINNLREKDRVAIVVYSGSAGEVLPSTSGSDKQKIREALDELTAGGSTAGGAGIKLAYKIAKNNFIKDGNNRVILCTDGDFNVGISSKEGLENMIESERKSGIFLTVLGYGMGNYKDNKMQVLAEKGNGNYAYIDNLQEANKVLVQEFGGTLCTVAKDVKLQLEFNPEHVQYYRLVGYESRLLNAEDFNDDTKDAGEMGAGHAVTAFYEIIPTGIEAGGIGKIDELKYQKVDKVTEPVLIGSPELATVKLRYKQTNEDISSKLELPVIDNKKNNTSSDFRFAAAVAMFGQIIRDSDYKGDANYNDVISLAKTALDNDEQGYRREFIRLVEMAKGLD